MENSYVIITDSNADLPIGWKEKHDLVVMSMPYIFDGVEYIYSESQSDPKAFFDAMRRGSMVTTVQRNAEEFKELMTPFLESGKDLIYLGFSSHLSGTFSAAMMARDSLAEKYPDRKIIVVDSLTICASQALLIRECAKMRESGATIDEVEAWLNENIHRACIIFCVEDLVYLKRGGRMSSSAAFFGTLLDVKPLIHLYSDGRVLPFDKVKGRKKAFKKLTQVVIENIQEPRCIAVVHADCLAEAQSIAESLKNTLGLEEIIINDIGPVIGAHTGPGTIGIAYFAKDRSIV